MTAIENKVYDKERALYNLKDAHLINCRFEGPADGESALKEGQNLKVSGSRFALRYPLWHVTDLELDNSEFTETARAALWYGQNLKISRSRLNGIKAVRECRRVTLTDVEAESPEFGWKCVGIRADGLRLTAEYAFLDSRDITLDRMTFSGKYSFQYVRGLTVRESHLKTKDAFWHSRNVIIYDSVIEGEYLGWYSDSLTFVRCHLKGTQPLCYCRNLRLIDCTMEEADLAFEYSSVRADIKGRVESIKNPRSGHIAVDSLGELIESDSVQKSRAKVIVRQK